MSTIAVIASGNLLESPARESEALVGARLNSQPSIREPIAQLLENANCGPPVGLARNSKIPAKDQETKIVRTA